MLLRLGIVGLTALAACADEGAFVTFAAPDGPAAAARVELVLASAKAETIGSGIAQRVAPGGLAMEDVVYYRERASGGIVEQVDPIDGFTVRIEPAPDAAPDETFIPFALFYDAQDALIAVGTVEDANGAPLPVAVQRDALVKYTLAVTPTAAPAPSAGLAPGQGLVVACRGDAVWTSGIAWRPARGPQLRLLLADRAEDASATDATARAADLDCDAYAATDDDCDDLRGAFHPDQDEACDGLDADCDGRTLEVQPCALPPGACGDTGVALCADTGTNNAPTTCQPDPTCACDEQLGGCARCVLDTRAGVAGQAGGVCAPAIGKLHIDGCDGACEVEIVQIDGPLEAKLAATELGPFDRVANAASGAAYLRVKYEESGLPATPTPYTSLGRVYLAVRTATRTFAHNVDLAIPDATSTCRPAALIENYAMTCVP